MALGQAYATEANPNKTTASNSRAMVKSPALHDNFCGGGFRNWVNSSFCCWESGSLCRWEIWEWEVLSWLRLYLTF